MNDLYRRVREKLFILDNMYDVMRIIDPINKNVINISNEQNIKYKSKCYEFLNRGTICKNCISMRVDIEKDTFIKLEYVQNGIVLIIATYITINEVIYIVEIIKNIAGQKSNLLNNNFDSCVKDMIDNLNEKVIREELTGTYNRTYVESRLSVDFNNSVVNKNALSIIMVDIGEFHNINDKHGNYICKEFFKEVSKLINESVEEDSYWIGRYSEDKYIIVLNNIDKEEACNISNKIRYLLKDIPLKDSNEIMKLDIKLEIYCSENEIVDIRSILVNLEQRIRKEKQKIIKEINREKKLSVLNYRIQELRNILNEMSISSNDKLGYKETLKISQDLDELIVEYMKNVI